MPSKPLSAPRQTAKVRSLAEDQGSNSGNTELDIRMLDRIRKCLDRAHHPNTPEMEAKAALHISSKLMAQYNVTQADLLAHASTDEEQLQRAGQSMVTITPTRSHTAKVVSQTWVHDVALAMEVFFDCKSYSSARTLSIDWTFYGIAPNTVAAALAFEMAHNLVLEWARAKKGATNSYCLGVGGGLWEMAKEGKRQEEREAIKKEQESLAARLKQERLDRQQELDRLNGLASAGQQRASYTAQVDDQEVLPDDTRPDHESSDDDRDVDSSKDEREVMTFDNWNENEEFETKPTFKDEDVLPLDPEAEFEEELQRILKWEQSTTPPLANLKCEDSDIELKFESVKSTNIKSEIKVETTAESSLWASSQQLALFRTTAAKIAEAHLKSKGTKLYKGRKPPSRSSNNAQLY